MALRNFKIMRSNIKLDTEYELLVREFHQSLLKAEGVEHIDVRHNVKIVGKSGASHQIDVYWKFSYAGVVYQTCIECRHYNSRVKKSHIAAFAEILRDIGPSTGIFATTIGYQSGAIALANHNNIRLLTINHLTNRLILTIRFLCRA